MVDALDLIGVFVFAVSGCLIAIRHRMDAVGLLALGLVTGLAGGILRDLLLGETPPRSLVQNRYLLVPVAAAVATVAVPRLLRRMRQPVLFFDAVGLGLFAVVGAARAHEEGVTVASAVLIGTIAAVGGGLLRDLLAGEVPQIFVAGSVLYAIPAAAGALLTVVGLRADLDPGAVQGSAAALVVLLRILALRYGWHAPLPHRNHD